MIIRQLLAAAASKEVLSVVLVCAFTVSTFGQDATDIVIRYDKGIQYRIQSQFQHAGQVAVDHAGQDSEPQNLNIHVKARLDYHERFVGSETTPQSVRFYDQSEAEIEVDKGITISKLAKQNQLIVTRIKPGDNSFQIASVSDMLQQHELDLLKNPADPLTHAGLVNREKVTVGEEWEPERDSLARFLSVDRVIQTDVKLKLKELDTDSAKVYMMGKVKADVDDVITEMNITAVLQIDLTAQLVSALRLNVKETRSPGQVAPGFDGKTKVDLKISVGDNVPELSSDSLREIVESHTIRHILKWEAESGSFALQYEPSWKMIASDEEAAVLRYLDNGDLLAQCNIVRLASRPPSKPLLLDEFKKEVAKIISADETAQLISASESKTANGLKALQVSVSGVEEEVPLNWVYYNIAHSDGRQVTFVFTLEEEIASRVSPAAKKLLDGFDFHAAPAKFEPKSKPAARDAKAHSNSETKR